MDKIDREKEYYEYCNKIAFETFQHEGTPCVEDAIKWADNHPLFNKKLVGKILDIIYDKEIEPIISESDKIAKETLYDYACEYNNGYRDCLIKVIKENWKEINNLIN